VVIRSDQYGLRHDDELTIGLTKFGGAEEEFPVPLRTTGDASNSDARPTAGSTLNVTIIHCMVSELTDLGANMRTPETLFYPLQSIT